MTAEKKGLCVTNMTGLLIACFVVIFTNINAFRSFTKKELFKEREVWRKTLLVKIIVTLVAQGLLRICGAYSRTYSILPL